MAAPYSYSGGAAQPPARPAFDLDDLLGTAQAHAPPPPPGGPPPPGSPSNQWSAAPQPNYPPSAPAPAPAPPSNDDPFGFNQQPKPAASHPPPHQYYPPYAGQQQQQQPQQVPAAAVPAYGYPAPPGVAATAAGPPPQHQQPLQTPHAPGVPAYGYAPHPQPAAGGQVQGPTPSYYPAPAPASQPVQAHAAPYAAHPTQGAPPLQAGMYAQPPQQHGQPYPSATPAAYGSTPAVVPPPDVQAYTGAAQQQQPSPSALSGSPQPPPGQYNASYSEDQDRANLERIRRLREQLEREHAAEQAALSSASSQRLPSAASPDAQPTRAATSSAADGWSCAACTFKNKLAATQCEICDEPRAGYSKSAAPAQTPASGSTAPSGSASGGGGGGSNPSGAPWTCEMCQGQNQGNAALCRICNSPRPQQQQRAAAPTGAAASSGEPLPPNVWACNNCTLHNPKSIIKCQACDYMQPGVGPLPRSDRGGCTLSGSPSTAATAAAPPALPAVYSCSTCTYENKITNTKCDMCAAARPEAVSQQINAYVQYQQGRAAAPPPPGQPGAGGMELPLTVNGRRLTPEEQRRLIQQQEAILADIQRGGAAAPVAGGRRQIQAEAQDESSDEDDNDVQWQKDEDAKRCTKCDAGFGLVVRRHHCRICGFVFCKSCCSTFMKVKPSAQREERVCSDCYREKTQPTRSPPPRTSAVAPVPQRSAYPASYAPPRTMAAPPPPPPPPAPPRQAVPCDCAGAEGGFHRQGCPNNRNGASSAQAVPLEFY